MLLGMQSHNVNSFVILGGYANVRHCEERSNPRFALWIASFLAMTAATTKFSNSVGRENLPTEFENFFTQPIPAPHKPRKLNLFLKNHHPQSPKKPQKTTSQFAPSHRNKKIFIANCNETVI